MFLLSVTAISVIVSAILFVCIEVPWSNTEKWLFSLILGGGKKSKKILLLATYDMFFILGLIFGVEKVRRSSC